MRKRYSCMRPRHFRECMLEVTEAMMAADLATPQFFLTRLVRVRVRVRGRVRVGFRFGFGVGLGVRVPSLSRRAVARGGIR